MCFCSSDLLKINLNCASVLVSDLILLVLRMIMYLSLVFSVLQYYFSVISVSALCHRVERFLFVDKSDLCCFVSFVVSVWAAP